MSENLSCPSCGESLSRHAGLYPTCAELQRVKHELELKNKQIKWYANQVINFATDDVSDNLTGMAVDVIESVLNEIDDGGYTTWTKEYRELLRKAVEDAP